MKQIMQKFLERERQTLPYIPFEIRLAVFRTLRVSNSSKKSEKTDEWAECLRNISASNPALPWLSLL